ncbi:MAG TPA: pseudouridine synthase [Hymenobacter sp.]|uniref:pseudouridine synthase n=1 Tax=Hymenobacter sp. TaxID=1898978 RepID=UPI002D7FA706|nr:pseudouridine synthase [Hymenobacter sp.]HET9503407.1 pseudouridine synthase [Hymenobacter sp.]
MAKQDFSNNKSDRRGPAGGSGRPERSNRPEGRGGYESRGNSGGYGAQRGGDRPAGRGEYGGARPAFGQGGGKFGGRPGEGGSRGGFGGNRSGEGGNRGGFGGSRFNEGGSRGGFGGGRSSEGGRPSFGGGRSNDGVNRGGFGGGRSNEGGTPGAFGDPNRRPYGGEARPARRFDAGENKESRGGSDERGERPAYPPKQIWQGQPVRYEGKPTVPRGVAGERNRKFIKRDPNAPADETTQRPAYTGRNERSAFEERGAGKAANYGSDRPFRREGGEQSEGRPERRSFGQRDGGEERKPYGERSGNSYGGDRKPYGERSGSSFGNDRGERKPYGERNGSREGSNERGSYGDRERKPYGERDGGFDKPRSTGERPNANAFRERREAMRDAVRGGRASGTTYGRADKPKYGEKPGEAPDYKNLKHYENDKTRGNKRRASEEDFGTEEMRLNRYIANAGICSRREADALIAAGEIRVNGEVVTEMGYKVQPSDTVQYGKTNLNREKLVYVLLNKPKDFITTTDDPEGRKTVMDLVKTASKERIFPVGRLDRNTTGLLLFTNDGEVAQKLSHPSHKNKKIYQVELDKPLTAEHLRQITEGLELEDGKAEVDDVAVVAGNPHFVGVELHIGRNRIVRRIFEHLGYDVVTLDRVQYAGITKKDLPRGKWRFLTEQEVIRLKYFM